MTTFRYYLSLGSNIEPRLTYIRKALDRLSELGDIKAKSGIYRAQAWGRTAQNEFLNAVVELSAASEPEQILTDVKKVEKELGRQPRRRWGPREIDIDILWSSHHLREQPDLTLPHPHMLRRRFVLRPLRDITDSLTIGGVVHNISDLLRQCPDRSMVEKLDTTW